MPLWPHQWLPFSRYRAITELTAIAIFPLLLIKIRSLMAIRMTGFACLRS